MQPAKAQTTTLFDSDEIIELTIKTDLKTLFNDRGQDPQYHQALLSYNANQSLVNIPLSIRCRGHFRKLAKNCKYPPLQLNFDDSFLIDGSIFNGQNKLKLVTPCRNEQHVIHEYLVYKLYNHLTPKCLKARLVKVILEDSISNKRSDSLYGIILEAESEMAARNHAFSIKKEGYLPQQIIKEDFLKMSVFEYMIGNTDWSVKYLQNVKLIAKDSTALPSPIPYDFDHAGIVRAPYAKPAPELQMTSTQQRRYRGYCITDMTQYEDVFTTFNELKSKFYAAYANNTLLTHKYKKQTLKYLDKFYETINDPGKAKLAFGYPCNKQGTGNVVIQGLKN